MVNERLLKQKLARYNYSNIKMNTVKYNKDLFKNIFDEYNDFGMTESSFCCYGLEHCCWQEVVEDGVWDLTLDDVKYDILKNIKRCKKYLYNGKKYGSNRLYIGEKEGSLYVYIYSRDVLGVDYSMWFAK